MVPRSIVAQVRHCRRAPLTLLPAALLLSGCIQTEIVGRYDRATCTTGTFDDKGKPTINPDADCTTLIPRIRYSAVMLTAAESAQLNGTAVPAAATGPAKPKTGFDMPERAMKAYIEELARTKDETTAKALRTYFAEAIGSAAQPDTGTKDLTGLAGTLNLTLLHAGVFNPGDRIERVRIDIQPKNARFRSWTAAITRFDFIAEGALGSTQSENADLSVSPTAALGLPFTGTAKVSATNALTQNLTVSRRVEDTTPVVDYASNTMTIVREGGAFRSLTGNTQVGLTLSIQAEGNNRTVLRNFYTVKDFGKIGAWVSPDKLDITKQTVFTAIIEDAVQAWVTMTYVIRHVLSGDGTSPERDDKVRFITVTEETPKDKPIVLVPMDRIKAFQPGLAAPNYRLVVKPQKLAALALRGADAPDEGEIFCFSDYKNAAKMIEYLQQNSDANVLKIAGKYEIGLKTLTSETFTPLDKPTTSKLGVETNCYDDPLLPAVKLRSVEGLQPLPQ
jgi:hypothetical protein